MNEGDVFEVKIIREVEWSPAERYWLLQTPAGEKMMLDFEPYVHYGLAAGNTIDVKVDKINCSGKVFLEPFHPLYKAGETAVFKLIAILENGARQQLIQVEDMFHQRITVHAGINIPIDHQGMVTLKVIGVRKGIPLLIDPELAEDRFYEENRVYPFRVGGKENIDDKEHFLLFDEHDRMFLLPAENYSHYHISVGETIHCTVTRIGQGGTLTLEPRHPYLAEGQILELMPESLQQGHPALGQRHILWLMRDVNGQVFFMSERYLKEKSLRKPMLCRIARFKKGQALVEPVNC